MQLTELYFPSIYATVPAQFRTCIKDDTWGELIVYVLVYEYGAVHEDAVNKQIALLVL